MTQTGANADEWVPVKPGTEGVLALGLAHVILANKLRPADGGGRAGARDRRLVGRARRLHAGDVSSRSPASPAQRVERLAREFAELRPAVAIVGGAPLAHTNGLFHALAVNALNALLGSVGQPGGIFFTPRMPQRRPPAPAAAARRRSRRHLQPVPAGEGAAHRRRESGVRRRRRRWKVREALEKVPFIVSFGSFIDDTSVLADLILPDHSFLESWVDAAPESGVARGR